MENNVQAQNEPVSVGEWIISYLLLCIPLVNIIMIFVWAFGSSTNPSKANFAKATLIFFLIFTVLWFLVIGSILSSLM